VSFSTSEYFDCLDTFASILLYWTKRNTSLSRVTEKSLEGISYYLAKRGQSRTHQHFSISAGLNADDNEKMLMLGVDPPRLLGHPLSGYIYPQISIKTKSTRKAGP